MDPNVEHDRTDPQGEKLAEDGESVDEAVQEWSEPGPRRTTRP